ncbi:MAG TPA: hypothetical protein PK668_15070 [Myxococcota bacterium]|nr:hypothetical protein [Myxococcota bacterium]HRY94215.1 hypothetical protein [Myxococcota bacterium]HSA20099.1 hypothetical protein [Myxococcota bacterium]
MRIPVPRLVRARWVAALLGLALGLPVAAPAAEPIGWLEILPPGPGAAGPAALAAREALGTRGLPLLGSEELLGRLRAADLAAGRVQAAGRLLAEGRQLHLGLKLPEALERYRQAVALLEEGCVRFYEPGRLAEPVLQIGVAEHQAGHRAEAEKAFMRAAALAPGLELDEGYYSPGVRAAFLAARERLGPLSPGSPRPEELLRMCQAAGLRGLVVVSSERVGDRPVLRLALFDATRARFVALENSMLDEAEVGDGGALLAERLWPQARVLAGIPEDGADGSDQVDGVDEVDEVDGSVDGGVDGGVDEVDGSDGSVGSIGSEEPLAILPPDGGPPPLEEEPPAWYVQHWWIWPVAAAVLGVAIALPLTVFREDVVDVRVRIH